MLVSEHIAGLQKILEEKGDQELFMWVDSGEDTLYLVRMPEIEFVEIDGNEYQIPRELRNEDGKILCIMNLNSQDFDEDEDAIQDMDLEIDDE